MFGDKIWKSSSTAPRPVAPLATPDPEDLRDDEAEGAMFLLPSGRRAGPEPLHRNGEGEPAPQTKSKAKETIQNDMIDALDRAALRLIAQLEGCEPGGTCQACGGDLVPPTLEIPDVIRVFDRCEKWLKESNKLRPTKDAEAEGIELYKQVMDNTGFGPTMARVQAMLSADDQDRVRKMMRAGLPVRGVKPPVRRAGHPSKADKEQRRRYQLACEEEVRQENNELEEMRRNAQLGEQ